MWYQSVYLFALYHHCQRNNLLDACQVAVLKYKKINITRNTCMIVVKVAVTIQVTANCTVSIHAVHLYQVGGVDGI